MSDKEICQYNNIASKRCETLEHNSKCYVEKVPIEIWIKIFNHFKQKELLEFVLPVCPEWRLIVANYQTFWNNVTCLGLGKMMRTNRKNTFSPDDVAQLFNYEVRICKLKVHMCSNQDVIKVFDKYAETNSIEASESFIQTIVGSTMHSWVNYLTSYFITAQDVINADMNVTLKLTPCNRHLKHLILKCCDITKKCIESLASVRKLEDVQFLKCGFDDDDVFLPLLNTKTIWKNVEIVHCSFHEIYVNFLPVVSLPTLQKLDLCCWKLDAVPSFEAVSQKLTHLTLSSGLLSGGQLIFISKKAPPSLISFEVYLSSLSNRALDRSVHYIPSLKRFVLSQQYTEENTLCGFSCVDTLKKCKNLKQAYIYTCLLTKQTVAELSCAHPELTVTGDESEIIAVGDDIRIKLATRALHHI